MKMLEPREREALERVKGSDYSRPSHGRMPVATELEEKAFRALLRDGRTQMTPMQDAGDGWMESHPVVTEMGDKALRVDALVRQMGGAK
jgi:hypothetical protein